MHPRVADRTQVDGVGRLELGKDRVRQDLPRSQVALGPNVIADRIQPCSSRRGDGLQDPKTLGDDLGTDAVAGDDGDPKRHRLQHNRQRFGEGFRPFGRYDYIVLTEEKALGAALVKIRRLRRVRRLSGLTYWAAWGFVGLVCLLLLAGGIAGLASG